MQLPLAPVPNTAIFRLYDASACSGNRTDWPDVTARSMAMVVSRLIRACSGVV